MPLMGNSRGVRFAVVGVVNTIIDFGIFLSLSTGGVQPVLANYASTTVALGFSFFANKKYTFKTTSQNIRKEVALFLIFTLIGLWVLQPIVILMTHKVSYVSPFFVPEWAVLVGSKVLATFVTLVWNYVTYSRYVFK